MLPGDSACVSPQVSPVMQSATVTLRRLPTSWNRTRHAHWSVARRAKRGLQDDLALLLLAARVPRGLERVDASAVLLVPDRRRRDVDNYWAPLSKSLGDALVAGGWLGDDTPDRFHLGSLTFELAPGRRETRLHLSWPVPAMAAGGPRERPGDGAGGSRTPARPGDEPAALTGATLDGYPTGGAQ